MKKSKYGDFVLKEARRLEVKVTLAGRPPGCHVQIPLGTDQHETVRVGLKTTIILVNELGLS